jgi:hypothetical protein
MSCIPIGVLKTLIESLCESVMAGWGEEDTHYSDSSSSDYGEDDEDDTTIPSDRDTSPQREVFFRYLRDLSHTINLSDFPPDDVEYCYGQVRELKTMQELDTLDKYGFCKLELAVNHGDLLMILVLLENGCSHMKHGWKNLLEEYYVTIFDEGGETNVRHVWTPLITAVKDEKLSGDSRLEIVNFLLTFDQNLNMGDEDYRTAAHWATFHGFPDILQALLVKGANVQETDIRAESLMDYAINKWTNTPAISINLVNVLLRNNFRVNTRNANMNTPLHLAVLASSEEIVLILLRNDANKWLKNEHGNTPMDIARTQGTQNMILLLKHAPMHRSGG